MYANIEHWLAAEDSTLANICARTPAMTEIVKDVLVGVDRFVTEHGLSPEELSPNTIVTSDGKIVVDLFGRGTV